MSTTEDAMRGATGSEQPPAEEPTRTAQNALTLYLRLKNPLYMPQVLMAIYERKQAIDDALKNLRYVHFARFVPVPDNSALFVITIYDHALSEYVLDFASVLNEPFSAILSFVADAPPLPVLEHPDEFVSFITRHNMAGDLFRAYDDYTVLEIQSALARADLDAGPGPAPGPDPGRAR